MIVSIISAHYLRELTQCFVFSNPQIIDNVNWLGKVALEPEDSEVYGVKDTRRLLQSLKDDKEVDVTMLGMAGVKGYDGILYAIKL